MFSGKLYLSFLLPGLVFLSCEKSEIVPDETYSCTTIRHLLDHTSGIADYYTLQYELDRINRTYNNWRQEDVLEYVYKKKLHIILEKFTTTPIPISCSSALFWKTLQDYH